MDRFELHNLDRASSQLEENFANIFVTILEMIGYSTKAITRKRWREYLARLLQGKDQTLEQLRRKLDLLVRDGALLVIEQINSTVKIVEERTVETATKLDEIRGNTGRIRMGIDLVKDSNQAIVNLLQSQHRVNHDKYLRDVLQPAQSNTDRMEGLLRKRIPGTGNWLHAEPAFQSWLRHEVPVLYICGISGSGKTFLASSITSHLLSRTSNAITQQYNVGFYFVSRDDVYTRTGGFHQVLRDIAWQITSSNSKYADYVSTRCRTTTDIDMLSSAWRALISN